MASKFNIPDFDEFMASGKQNGERKSGGTNSHKQDALNFAHPIDAGIIKVLDNKAVNELFEKYVDASVDLSMGLALSSSVKVSETTNPEIYYVIKDCSEKLNIPIPYTVISSSVKGINAQTAGTDEFAFIAVSSLLTALFNEDEQKFVLGHECGHIALGHVVYHTAISTIGTLGSLVPIVGNVLASTIQFPLNAWSRRSEISADRAGLICCGDLRTAKRSLLRLEAGFMSVDNIDIDEYLDNSMKFRKNNSLGKFTELFNEHPIIPKRIEALELFANSKKYYRCSGKSIPNDKHLIEDDELERKTEAIIKIIG